MPPVSACHIRSVWRGHDEHRSGNSESGNVSGHNAGPSNASQTKDSFAWVGFLPSVFEAVLNRELAATARVFDAEAVEHLVD